MGFLASPSLELQSRFSRPTCPNLGNRERDGQPKRLPKNGSGPLETFSKSPPVSSRMVFSSLARNFESLRRGCSSANTWPLGLGFLRRRWSGRFLPGCFTAAPAEQRQGVLGTEGEAANGLLTGSAQSDVDAPVVGQAHGQQVFQELLLLRRGEVRIVFEELLHLFGGHVLFEAESPSLEVVRRYALLHEEALGAFHAPLGELDVVVFGPANVRVTFENQVGVRPIRQILLEVARQRIECDFLAGQQPSHGFRHGGLRRREVNAVQR